MIHAVDSDEDILEVFYEEAGEVFDSIDDRLDVWRNMPTDRNALTEIRRSFHTLKGSGRMVNALDFAEVAWKVENLLNRVIDGRVQAKEPLFELVFTARDLLPRMLDAFKNGRSMEADTEVEALIARADALAAGQAQARARTEANVAALTRESKQSLALGLVKLSQRLERVQKRSDEALQRSEMALQHARRIGAHAIALKGEARERVGREEFHRFMEEVDRLAGEVRDLRRDTKQPHQENLPDRRELNQLIDQLVRERMATVARQRGVFERQLGEAQSAAAVSSRLARLSLICSALVGAGAVAALMMLGLPLG